MEAKYHNYSTDQCNAMMMELMENEKHGMETKPKYLPITMYNAIMLLMINEKQNNLETLCNKFPIFLEQSQDVIAGKRKSYYYGNYR